MKKQIKINLHEIYNGKLHYETTGSAAFDLKYCGEEPVIIKPNERKLLQLGIKSEFDKEYCVKILPRSGLAIKQGITVLNAPGLIDSDYRDEWKVILINQGSEDVVINKGDRVCQAQLENVIRATFDYVKEEELSTSKRKGGFGSTGIK